MLSVLLPSGKQNVHQSKVQAQHPLRWCVHLVKVKYCDDKRPEKQIAKATDKRFRLERALAQRCHK